MTKANPTLNKHKNRLSLIKKTNKKNFHLKKILTNKLPIILILGLFSSYFLYHSSRNLSEFEPLCENNGALYYKDGNLICKPESSNEQKTPKTEKSEPVPTKSTPFWLDNSVTNSLTVDNTGDIHWKALSNYPSSCGTSQAIQSLGDTITCVDITEVTITADNSSLWLNNGAITYLSSTSDDFTLGGSNTSSPFFFDTSEETLNLSNLTITNGATLNNTGGNNDVTIKGTSDNNLLFSDASTNRVGIGTNAPTAFLDIKAGTVDQPSLRIRDGAQPSSANAGDIFVTNKTLHFVSSKDHRTVNLADGVITSDTTVANTTTETTIFTENISPGELHTGQVVECNLFGRYSTVNAADTFTMRFKVGGNTIESKTSVAGSATNSPWQVKYLFTVRETGVNGRTVDYVSAIFNNVHDDKTNTSDNTLNTSAASNFTATAQWDSADTSNSLTVSQAWCEFIN